MDPYSQMLKVLESALDAIQAGMEKPSLCPQARHNHMHRLPNMDINHAITTKAGCAMLSALNAAHILMRSGHVLEQGALKRIADEAEEDVFFLVLAIRNGTTNIHQRWLAAFWGRRI